MVTHPPTQRWGKKMKSESEKNRRSSTSRIVDITETLGKSQGRTRQVVVERGNDRECGKEMCG
jgi:hypothetical protein